MCDNCRRFAQQLEQMGVALRQLSQAGDICLSDEEAERRILVRVQGGSPQNQPPSKKTQGLENTADAGDLGAQAHAASGTTNPPGGNS